MFTVTETQFKASVIARCFIVGFRFFRQTPEVRQQLLDKMFQAIDSTVFGVTEEKVYADSNDSLFSAFMSYAVQNNTAYPEENAQKVLCLVSPMFASQYGVPQEQVDAVIAEGIRSYPNFSCLALAYAGNVKYSGFVHAVNDIVPVFNEDIAESRYFVPSFNPDVSWADQLEDRREAQYREWDTANLNLSTTRPYLSDPPAEVIVDMASLPAASVVETVQCEAAENDFDA